MKNLIAVVLFIAALIGGAYFYVKYQMDQEAEQRKKEEVAIKREKEEAAKRKSESRTQVEPLKGLSSKSTSTSSFEVNKASGPLRNYRPVQKATDAFNTHNSQLEKAASDK